MRIRTKIVAGLLALVLAVIACWQTAACELANVELRDDLHDLASQVSARIGLVDFNTDIDFRYAVIRKAEQYDIYLQPEQITVRRSGTLKEPIFVGSRFIVEISNPRQDSSSDNYLPTA